MAVVRQILCRTLGCQTERLTQHVARVEAIAGRDTSGFFHVASTAVVREILSRTGPLADRITGTTCCERSSLALFFDRQDD